MLEDLMARSLMIDRARVDDDLAYNSIPEWDSLAHMALVAEIELQYGLMLDTDDIVAMSSTRKIREILSRYDVHG